MQAHEEPAREWLSRRGQRRALLVVILCALVGCTRRYYREFADRDVYRIEQERMTDPRWNLPVRPVEADPKSRIGDPHDPDHMPIPPDDPGARPFQVTAGKPFEFIGWEKRGMTPVEDLSWLALIPREPDGTFKINGPSAMRVALMNSRDYQFNLEDVYISALLLTTTRFAFFPQIFNSQNTQYRHFGEGKNQSNQLQLFTNDGFNWALYTGASLLVNFANSMIFEYNGKGFQTVNSGLAINFVQPLLRGAWARNVTQQLSAAERATLAAVRKFAHFRRTFYVTTVSNYLGLLFQLQGIRNQEDNLEALKRNVEEYDALVRAGQLNAFQRDTLAQTYQQSRGTLLSQQAFFQTTLDTYRVTQLGLPADFPVTIDESPLKQFELNDSRLDDLRAANDALYLSLLQYLGDPPGKEVMRDSARKVLGEFRQLSRIADLLDGEFERWRRRIESEKARMGQGVGPIEEDDRESLKRQIQLADELAKGFAKSRETLAFNIDNTEEYLEKLDAKKPAEAWTEVQALVGRDLRARLSELFVIQTQVRVHLIELKPVDLTLAQAISVGLGNRLDLMTALANVTDAWRFVEADGNQLLATVNLFYNGSINTDPKHLGVLRFDSSNSLHTMGIQVQAPINRRAQRNQYRTDQITFQRARRNYMLAHDTVVQSIRFDLRQLNLNRRQFEIGREQLLIAARQVDTAEYNARTATGDSSAQGQTAGTQLQSALQVLLQAKNGLIQNWVAYESQRIELYSDFDTMEIDSQGVWINDGSVPTLGGKPVPAVPDPLGISAGPLLPLPASDDVNPLGAAGEPFPDPPPAGVPGPFAPR